MSTDVLERVETLVAKAGELVDKGHLLRAAENYVLAAEVARSLGPDNLVSVYMLLRQGATLGSAGVPRAGRGEVAAHLQECLSQ